MVAAVHQPLVNAWVRGAPCVSPAAGITDVSSAHVTESDKGLPPNFFSSSSRSLGASAWGTQMATVGPSTIARRVMLTARCATRAMFLTGQWWGYCPRNSSPCFHACTITALRVAVGPTTLHQERRNTTCPPPSPPWRKGSRMGICMVTAGSPGPPEPKTATPQHGRLRRPSTEGTVAVTSSRQRHTYRGSGSAPPTRPSLK